MKTRVRCTGIMLSVLLVPPWPSVVSANPIAVTPWGLYLAPALFIVEGIVIVLLAKRSAPYPVRFVAIWFLVTLSTFVGLVLGAAPRGMESEAATIVAFAVGECIVMIVEAGAIWLLLRWRFLARNLSAPPSFPRALVYSVIANLVSLGGGALLVVIIDNLSLS